MSEISRKKYITGVKRLTVAAMLCAMSVVIGIFCKTLLNFGNGLFRVTFENLPIILSGILLGPVFGGLVGGAADLISYLLSAQAYPLNIIVTVGSVAIGVTSGIVSKFIVKRSGYLQIILSAGFSHIVGSMIIKSIGLFTYYGYSVLLRIPVCIIIASIEITILCMLYRSQNFKKITEDIQI